MAKRRLTTVFCADIDGYTKLMSRDEEKTLERMQRCRSLMRKLFDQHHGHEINTWGDAVIAEFESVVEAVRCAVALQDAMETENLTDKNPAMRFRIGINLGDVMDDGNSVYGDGVNAAARLEAACEPGGVLISDTVYSLVHKQLAVRFDRQDDLQSKPGEDSLSGYMVVRDRRNFSDHNVLGNGTGAETETTDEEEGPLSKYSKSLGKLEKWFMRQPKVVKTATGMIGFFFMINLLFSGLATPWFVFPSIPFAITIWLKRNRDGENENA